MNERDLERLYTRLVSFELFEQDEEGVCVENRIISFQ